jgi:hypothetical protein
MMGDSSRPKPANHLTKLEIFSNAAHSALVGKYGFSKCITPKRLAKAALKHAKEMLALLEKEQRDERDDVH